MNGVGQPHLLLRGNQSPHTFSLRPSDARELHRADLLFWIGPELEAPLARILPNLGDTRGVAMLTAPGINLLPLRRRGHLHEHDGSDQDADSEQHTHTGRVDPHIWLSPDNAIAMAKAIAAALVEIDPANSPRYRENLAALTHDLTMLDDTLAKSFAPIQAAFAVFHDAFQYLEHRYALHSIGAVTTQPEDAPGAAHLHELYAELGRQNVHCIFSEPQFADRTVSMLNAEHGLRHVVLDPLGSNVTPGPEAYRNIMLNIADALSRCMQQQAHR